MEGISLCMIVRDEEQNLGRCLASACGVVDEVCVVDTGSGDRTLAIAVGSGARIARRPWDDDFAAARNASLALARGRWILVLDADEEILDRGCGPAPRARLQAFARSHPSSAGRVAVESLDPAGDRTTVAITRFFPNDGRHRYAGRVHEQVVRHENGAARTPRSTDTGLEILHHGYAMGGDARAGKLARNERLLRLALADEPDDGYLWYQLGRTRAQAGDHLEALSALEQGLARCPDDAPWAAPLLEAGAYSLRALGRSSQALALLSEVEEGFRDRADTCFLVALLAMDCGEIERAERGFRRCLDLAERPSGAAESSRSAATSAPAFNLGVLCEVQGHRDQAAMWYRRALELEPGHAPSQAGLARLGD